MTRSFVAMVVVVSVLLGLSAAGCKLGPDQPYPAKDRFGLQIEGVGPAHSSPSGTIRVATVRVAPPYDETGFVYRTGDLTYNSDYYNQFVAEPSALLTGAIVGGLTTTKRFATVVGPSSVGNASCTLEITVTELCGDFRAKGHPKAAITLRAALLQDIDAGTLVLSQAEFVEAEPIGSTSPADVCRGWGVALGRCITRMSEWAHGALPASARAPTTSTSSR